MRNMRHLHPLSDPNDRAPPKSGYNFSRSLSRSFTESEIRSSHEDFLRPKSLVDERSTGYSRGHIRSIMDFDTFGPQHSDLVNQERNLGIKPMSPNSDRYSSRPNSSCTNRSSSKELSMLRTGSLLENGVLTRSGNLPVVVVPLHFDQKHKIYDISMNSSHMTADSHTRSLAWSQERYEKLKVIITLRRDWSISITQSQ